MRIGIVNDSTVVREALRRIVASASSFHDQTFLDAVVDLIGAARE